jgi:hypothetical protein
MSEDFEYLRLPQNQPHLKVMEVLRRWDPIGVICDSCQDEYDGHSVQVVRMLDADATVESLPEYLRWVVTERVGIDFDEARSRDCAEEFVRYWSRRMDR